MTNLLHETIEDIAHSGHTVPDVVFIGSDNAEYSCTWAEFEQLANQEYDSGFGAAEVAGDLIIRFSDGKKMWRHEYDGSECWYYDAPGDVDYSKQGKPIVRLIGGMWSSVAGLQDPRFAGR